MREHYFQTSPVRRPAIGLLRAADFPTLKTMRSENVGRDVKGTGFVAIVYADHPWTVTVHG